MSQFTGYLRRFGLPALWLSYGILVARGGKNPGFVAHPESIPYPVGAVLTVWALLGLETALLWLGLRFRYGLVIGFAAAVLAAVASVVTLVTDMPGYYYAAIFYQIVLAALYSGALVVRVVSKLAKGSTPVAPAV